MVACPFSKLGPAAAQPFTALGSTVPWPLASLGFGAVLPFTALGSSVAWPLASLGSSAAFQVPDAVLVVWGLQVVVNAVLLVRGLLGAVLAVLLVHGEIVVGLAHGAPSCWWGTGAPLHPVWRGAVA
eukprot:6892817-Pyramimonas_sp.AAC.1